MISGGYKLFKPFHQFSPSPENCTILLQVTVRNLTAATMANKRARTDDKVPFWNTADPVEFSINMLVNLDNFKWLVLFVDGSRGYVYKYNEVTAAAWKIVARVANHNTDDQQEKIEGFPVYDVLYAVFEDTGFWCHGHKEQTEKHAKIREQLGIAPIALWHSFDTNDGTRKAINSRDCAVFVFSTYNM